jgi:hypothetical protein
MSTDDPYAEPTVAFEGEDYYIEVEVHVMRRSMVDRALRGDT